MQFDMDLFGELDTITNRALYGNTPYVNVKLNV